MTEMIEKIVSEETVDGKLANLKDKSISILDSFENQFRIADIFSELSEERLKQAENILKKYLPVENNVV